MGHYCTAEIRSRIDYARSEALAQGKRLETDMDDSFDRLSSVPLSESCCGSDSDATKVLDSKAAKPVETFDATPDIGTRGAGLAKKSAAEEDQALEQAFDEALEELKQEGS